MSAYHVKATGDIIPLPDGKLTLEEAQKLVGGYVERVFPRLHKDIMFLCDEEALLKHEPRVNALGTVLYNAGTGMPPHPIAGDIVLFIGWPAIQRSGWGRE